MQNMRRKYPGETNNMGADKISLFGWKIKDEPGTLVSLPKTKLRVSDAYQRQAVVTKVVAIASHWSWVACGVLIVGMRDGEYWVVDGQHRLLAARKRSDISELPCIVFETESEQQEADGFLDVNTGRKPLSVFARFKALIVAGDQAAIGLDRMLMANDLTATASAHRPRDIKCLGICLQLYKEDVESFSRAIGLAARLSDTADTFVSDKLLQGLYYIDRHVEGGLQNKRLADRCTKIGADRLKEAAQRAAAFFTAGGSKVWAQGMLEEINKGLHMKFKLSQSTEEV